MAKIHQICAALHADRGKVAGKNALVTTRAPYRIPSSATRSLTVSHATPHASAISRGLRLVALASRQIDSGPGTAIRWRSR